MIWMLDFIMCSGSCVIMSFPHGSMFSFRMPPRRPPHRNEEEPLPPPSLAHVLATMEGNRVRTEQILEHLVQNQNQNQNCQGQCVSLADFLRVGPPFFSNPKEPLDADDWLRSVQRKFAAHHVPAAEHVNFAPLKTGRRMPPLCCRLLPERSCR